MLTLESEQATALDENARAFVVTFIRHVTAIAGDDESRMAIVGRVNVLLLAALTAHDSSASAWHMLHRTIAEIIGSEHAARNAPYAYTYLRSFVSENRDLIHD